MMDDVSWFFWIWTSWRPNFHPTYPGLGCLGWCWIQSKKSLVIKQNMFSVHLVTEVGISLQVLLNQDGRKSVEFIIRNCGIHQSKWWFFLELMYLDLRKSLGIRTYNEEKLILAFWRVCGMEPMQSITNGGHISISKWVSHRRRIHPPLAHYHPPLKS